MLLVDVELLTYECILASGSNIIIRAGEGMIQRVIVFDVTIVHVCEQDINAVLLLYCIRMSETFLLVIGIKYHVIYILGH
jgi:hypothetical protein